MTDIQKHCVFVPLCTLCVLLLLQRKYSNKKWTRFYPGINKLP